MEQAACLLETATMGWEGTTRAQHGDFLAEEATGKKGKLPRKVA